MLSHTGLAVFVNIEILNAWLLGKYKIITKELNTCKVTIKSRLDWIIVFIDTL
jgi:hypothetical protein